MRKNYLLRYSYFSVLSTCLHKGHGQPRRLLRSVKEDTTLINLMNRIASDYAASRPDSTLKYGNDALTLSKRQTIEGEKSRPYLILAGHFLWLEIIQST